MSEASKIQAFEYLISKLLDWHNQSFTNRNNDLSILKILKLTFFVSAVGTNNESRETLLDEVFDNYVAMPYGHVESDIYGYIKKDILPHYLVNNRETIQKEPLNSETIDKDVRLKIDSSISLLKSINNDLIKLSSFDLVDLSHTWYSWQKYFSKAQSIGVNSLAIPTEEIKKEDKIYQI